MLSFESFLLQLGWLGQTSVMNKYIGTQCLKISDTWSYPLTVSLLQGVRINLHHATFPNYTEIRTAWTELVLRGRNIALLEMSCWNVWIRIKCGIDKVAVHITSGFFWQIWDVKRSTGLFRVAPGSYSQGTESHPAVFCKLLVGHQWPVVYELFCWGHWNPTFKPTSSNLITTIGIVGSKWNWVNQPEEPMPNQFFNHFVESAQLKESTPEQEMTATPMESLDHDSPQSWISIN